MVLRQLSTSIPHDVIQANQELDELFGTSYLQPSPRAASPAMAAAHQPFQPPVMPPTPSFTSAQTDALHGSDPSTSYAPAPGRAAAAAVSSTAASMAAAGRGSDGARLTHVDESGKASMVDVSQKPPTTRTARASATVLLGPAAYALVAANRAAKGDVLGVAQLAGIMAAKHTATLIPLCHNIPLSKVQVDLSLDAGRHAVHVSALARTVGATGVEMEALTAASMAALTVYDMCKAVSKDMIITDVRLDAKEGGASGAYVRGQGPPAEPQ